MHTPELLQSIGELLPDVEVEEENVHGVQALGRSQPDILWITTSPSGSRDMCSRQQSVRNSASKINARLAPDCAPAPPNCQ